MSSSASASDSSAWQAGFRAATAAVIGEPFWACLAESIATVESASGARAIHGPIDGVTDGLNEIGYKAVPGKPSAGAVTHEAAGAGGGLQKTSARFRLFRDRGEQAASLLFLLRGSAYYESARLLFILAFYAAYAPGRADGVPDLLRVFNRLAGAGAYPGVRPLGLLDGSADAATLALNHAAARDAVRLFGALTRSPL